MRFVVCGAGAVGGVLGARLFQHGRDVTLVARGTHLGALRTKSLQLREPSGEVRLPIPAVAAPADIDWRGDEVAVLTVKTQDSPAMLDALAAAAPPETAVVCAQNGVRNEAEAQRRFAHVYGGVVNAPTAHLQPGVVLAYSAPLTGVLDVGCYHCGVDDRARIIAAVLNGAGFDSRAVSDIARWKYRKLLTNLGNAVEVVCGPDARPGPLVDLATEEGQRCLRSAGIEVATAEEDTTRRGRLIVEHAVDGTPRAGGSTWQSVARGTSSIETDHLNGEIVTIGRLCGFPTPVNALLVALAHRVAEERGRRPPMTLHQVRSMLENNPPGADHDPSNPRTAIAQPDLT